jgi:cyclopropane-fatty-acyl-phospholipid synthase
MTLATERTFRLLDDVFGSGPDVDVAVRLWDGTAWRPNGAGKPRATVLLRHPGALRAMLWPPTELTLAEAYLHDDFDVEGDLEAVFPLADTLTRPFTRTSGRPGFREGLHLAQRVFELPAPPQPGGAGRGPAVLRGLEHSAERDRAAVTYHYDLSNDFFRLFLDQRMVYSCAYFEREDASLDQAQEAKLDLLCRKLRLRDGERLLDVGCGWGALVLHAVERYGVQALGITLSEPQAELARRRIRAAGLGRRAAVEVRDYRELDEPDGFDKIVSVGMFEHVGAALLPEYFRCAATLLRPGGVFLNHGIARLGAARRGLGSSFVGRYVFPDGELVPLAVTVGAAEGAGLEVRDVENLREHYTLTLRQWVANLERNHEAAVAAAGQEAYRVWRLYMAGSAHAFATGRLAIHQILLAKADRGRAGLPLTREDWYAD